MDGPERRRRVLREYVTAVACLGAAGVGGVFASTSGQADGSLAAVAVVFALGYLSFGFPVMRTGSAGARSYHLVEAPLTAALLLLDPRRALLSFVAGIALGWLFSGRSFIKIVFGISEHAVAGSMAVFVVQTAGRLHLPGGPEPYVPLAVAVYFVVNNVLNCVVFELAALRRKGEPFFVELGPSAVVAALGVATGGFVGLLGHHGPGAVLIATIPLALVFLLSRAHANRARMVDLLQGIVSAVADTHAGMASADVEQAVCARVIEVLDCPDAAIRLDPPAGEEIGVPVPTSAGNRWLVAQPRPVEAFRPEETDLLRAMAGVAGRALENAYLHEQLARQALHDPLTGLANRRLLTSELERSLARARRSGDRVGVAFLDLTGFKAVNDLHGHDAGDELLREVAVRLTASVRAGDVVGRIGGDEFVLVFPTLDDTAVLHVGARVLDAFEAPYALGDAGFVSVHCNMGIATWPADGDTADELLRRADAAMYEAKRTGGNTIAYAGGVPQEVRP